MVRLSQDVEAKANILYIAGSGRSGSTLLESFLNACPEIVGVGELAALEDAVHDPVWQCTCGSVVRDCEFWKDVLNDGQNIRIEDLGEVARPYRMRYFAVRLFRDRLGKRNASERAAQEYLSGIYEGIRRVSGARWIVDSTKLASRGLLAARAAGDRLLILHVVRDPRAVAYSWSMPKFNPARGKSMKRYTLLGAAVRWSVENFFVECLKLCGIRLLRVRYEDFLDDPVSNLRSIQSYMRINIVDEPSCITEVAGLEASYHSVSGNPNRFDTSPVALEVDDRFRKELGLFAQIAIMIVTAPLAWRYGYFRARSRSVTR